jgi:2-polyprenyl-6-methoxyphenol hydroxylase-like FAD-dependent oxidoreductase
LAQALEIVVVGAGVAGLASAIMLSRLGYRVTVYERFETSRPIGSGLMLQPTGLAALERLGLRRQIDELGHRIERLHGVTTTGTTIFDLGYGDFDPALHALAVHRSALHQALWTGFERSGASLEAGRSIAAVEAASGSAVKAVDDQGRVLPAADLIIDASGARSPLRAWVTERRPRQFPYGAVWATVQDIGIAPQALTQRYVDARIMIGYLPLGRLDQAGPPLAAFFWSLKPADHAAWRADFAGWRGQVEALWPAMRPVLQAMNGPDDLTLASYTHFTADRLSRGNLVLIGDAAHATSPQLGQGANQGLIDAVVLADALAQRRDRDAALELYARTRRRHVRFYQRASWIMTPFFQSDSVLLSRLRDLTFDRMKLVPWLRHEMVRTLAGLKTGALTWREAEAIVNGLAGTTEADAIGTAVGESSRPGAS